MELRARPEVERMQAAIAGHERPALPLRVREAMAIDGLRAKLREATLDYFDATLPFRQIAEHAGAALGASLPASRDPYKWSRTLSARVIDTLKGFQHEGVIDWTTRQAVPGTKGYEAIVRAVAGNQEDFPGL